MVNWLRPEDDRLTRGAGRYPSNASAMQTAQHMLYAAFVRSTQAHARITRIDTAAISQFKAQVFTGDDLAGITLPAINPLLKLEPLALQATPLLPATNGAAVTAIGAPLAVVLAASPELAQLAAQQVVVSYESLPAISDGADDAPLIAKQTWGDALNASAAQLLDTLRTKANAADCIAVAITHNQPRVAPFTLEPRCLQATWDAASQHLTVRMGSQTPSRTQSDIALALGLAASQVRVISEDVGGAYGAKSTVYPEELIVAWAAKHLHNSAIKTSIHWRATRSEEFESGNHGRGGHLQGTLWVKKGDSQEDTTRGQLVHLQTDTRFFAGSWLPFSVVAPALNSARILPGPYALASVDLHAQVQQSNTASTNIYRGAGRPEACLLMERLMDEAAHQLGMDPLAMRLRNLVSTGQMPFVTAAGQRLDSGDFAGLLTRCAEVFGYADLRDEQTKRYQKSSHQTAYSLATDTAALAFSTSSRMTPSGITPAALRPSVIAPTDIDPLGNSPFFSTPTGRAGPVEVPAIRGIGIACFTEPCGTGFESATVRLHADGSVFVMSGSADQGQGHSATYATIAAEALGCSPGAVRVLEGDTATCPAGVGALASRSTAIGGSAVLEAAQQVLALKNQPDCIYPIEATAKYTPAAEAWSAGCTMAQVQLDMDTGEVTILKMAMVDDAGRIINPKLAHGQLLGGAAQGLGQAMMERLVYSDSGQLLTGSLMDYAVPRASDMPPISINHLPSITSANILGAKGVGEAGTIGVPAAILNAVVDALRQSNPSIDDTALQQLSFPLTSEKIWTLLQTSQSR